MLAVQRCRTQGDQAANSVDFLVHYNWRYVDEKPSRHSDLHPLMLMAKYNRGDLLAHPVVSLGHT